MKHLLLSTITLLAVFMSPALAAPQSVRAVLPGGLTVIAVQDDSSALAGVHCAVRVDPANIPDSRAGTPAVAQQLLLDTLPRRLQEERWETLADVQHTRGRIGFNTEVDYCEALAGVTDEMLPKAMEFVGQMMLGEVDFRPEEFDAARETLANSLVNQQQSVGEITYYRFLEALYGSRSPWARPVQGNLASLAEMSLTDVQAFRSTYMQGNNAVMCVVAPRPVAEIMQLAETTLGHYGGGRKVSVTPPPMPARSAVRVGEHANWQGVSLMVGVPAPSFGTRDFVAVQLIQALLGGENGRLRRDPRLRAGIGLNRLFGLSDDTRTPVTVIAPLAMGGPFLGVHVVTIPRGMENTRAAIVRHFEELMTTPPTAAELEAARARVQNAQALTFYSKADFAKLVNSYEIYGADHKNAWRFAEEAQALRGDEIVEVARTYFGTHAVGVVLPGE